MLNKNIFTLFLSIPGHIIILSQTHRFLYNLTHKVIDNTSRMLKKRLINSCRNSRNINFFFSFHLKIYFLG